MRLVHVCGVPHHSLWVKLNNEWMKSNFFVNVYNEHGCIITTISDEPLSTSPDLILSITGEQEADTRGALEYDELLDTPVHISAPETLIRSFDYYGYLPGCEPREQRVVRYEP